MGTTHLDKLNLSSSPVYPVLSPDTTVTAKASSATLTSAELATIITNTGASGTVAYTLPAASTMVDRAMKIQLTVAQIVRPTPASGEKIYFGGSGVASKYLNIPAAIGNFVDLYCDGSSYLVTNTNCALTKEA